MWRPVTPAFEVPYVPVIVDMEEGWRMLADLVGCEHDAVHVGMPVEVEFFAHSRGHHPALLPSPQRLTGGPRSTGVGYEPPRVVGDRS